MAWDLGSWMVFVRSLQLLATLVCAALNGFLLAHIILKKLGPSSTLLSLEWIICLVLCYTALNLLILHSRGRSKITSWLVFSIVMDVLCSGADMAVITLLARSGVPSNCAGLTRYDFESDDMPNNPDDGYSTVRFGNELTGGKGELDKFCALDRAYYFVAVALMFSYTATIVLAILRICEDKYVNKKLFNLRMNALHDGAESYELVPKLESLHSPVSHSPREAPPPVPPSEGIMSRRESIRPLSQSRQSPHHVTGSIPRRIPSLTFASPSRSFASPSRRSMSPPPLAPPPSSPPPLGLGIVSDQSVEQMAAAAMVTDGGRFSGGYQPGMSTLPPYSASSPVRPSSAREEDSIFPPGQDRKGSR